MSTELLYATLVRQFTVSVLVASLSGCGADPGAAEASNKTSEAPAPDGRLPDPEQEVEGPAQLEPETEVTPSQPGIIAAGLLGEVRELAERAAAEGKIEVIDDFPPPNVPSADGTVISVDVETELERAQKALPVYAEPPPVGRCRAWKTNDVERRCGSAFYAKYVVRNGSSICTWSSIDVFLVSNGSGICAARDSEVDRHLASEASSHSSMKSKAQAQIKSSAATIRKLYQEMIKAQKLEGQLEARVSAFSETMKKGVSMIFGVITGHTDTAAQWAFQAALDFGKDNLTGRFETGSAGTEYQVNGRRISFAVATVPDLLKNIAVSVITQPMEVRLTSFRGTTSTIVRTTNDTINKHLRIVDEQARWVAVYNRFSIDYRKRLTAYKSQTD